LEITKSAIRFLERQEPTMRKRIALALDEITQQEKLDNVYFTLEL